MKAVFHFGISGGKDSTRLLLWAIHESGYPIKQVRFSFADTGNEAPETYEYIQMLNRYISGLGYYPIETIHPVRDFYELVVHKRIFPSAKRRFCTTELKLEPMRKHVFAMEQQYGYVMLHSGVRAAESADRALLKELDIDSYTGLPVRRPLLHMSINDVWDGLAYYGIPPNPLYALGMSRVGCFPCCMSSKSEMRAIKLHRPARAVFLRNKEIEVNERLGPETLTYRTFFHAGTVPKSQRTHSTIDREGQGFKVCTIDDVFRWAMTSHGGQQYDWNFDDELGGSACHRSGACE